VNDEPNIVTLIMLIIFALMTGCITRASRPRPAPTPPEATPMALNSWYDPVDARWWVLGDRGVEWSDARAACVGHYRLPDGDELRLVRARGVCRGQDVCPVVWGPSVTITDALTVDLATGVAVVARKSETTPVTYCVEVKS
jgi:hypothetical protein